MHDIIKLPYGGNFSLTRLIEKIQSTGGTLIIGARNCRLDLHPYQESLDYWLRTNGATSPDTRQTNAELLQTLTSRGNLEKVKIKSPYTGHACYALRFRKN